MNQNKLDQFISVHASSIHLDWYLCTSSRLGIEMERYCENKGGLVDTVEVEWRKYTNITHKRACFDGCH